MKTKNMPSARLPRQTAIDPDPSRTEVTVTQ